MQKHIHFDVMRVAISTTHTDRRFPSSGKFAFGRAISPSFCPVHPPPRAAGWNKFLIYSMGRLTVTPKPQNPFNLESDVNMMHLNRAEGVHSLTVWLVRYSTRFWISCSSPTLTLLMAFSCTIKGGVNVIRVAYCGTSSSHPRRALLQLLSFSSNRSTKRPRRMRDQLTGNWRALLINKMHKGPYLLRGVPKCRFW